MMKVRFIGKSDPLSLINGKIYECLAIENGLYRIIDEEGIDEDEEIQGYLYESQLFEIIND